MVAKSAADKSSKKLVDALVSRLKGPLTLEEPFILQDRIPQTRSRHVLVIWDAWRQLEPAARSAIIMDALSEAGMLKGDSVRVAVGLTQEEALDLGYLPFKIVSTVHKSDPVRFDDVRAAFESVGGIHVRTGASHQVRFPSQEHAEEAYRRLASKIPGPYWAIVQEVAQSDRA